MLASQLDLPSLDLAVLLDSFDLRELPSTLPARPLSPLPPKRPSCLSRTNMSWTPNQDGVNELISVLRDSTSEDSAVQAQVTKVRLLCALPP